MRFSLFLIIIILGYGKTALADKFTTYYASIKSSEVNVRKGPNTRYPIDWVFKKKGEPVEVIAQFEHWHRIKDISGDEGWVKSVMLSKKRTGVVNTALPNNFSKPKVANLYAKLYHQPDASTKVFAEVEASQRVEVLQCQKQWCKLKVKEISGWIEKPYLWGVYANEEFK
jgi:SH3-like domain-containing protein